MDCPNANQFDALAPEIGRVLISRKEIRARLEALAAEIIRDYAGRQELIVLAVLTGSLLFVADLIRRLPLRMRLEMVRASSYPGKATRAGALRLDLPDSLNLSGRDVLILDDILDSGQTLAALRDWVRSQAPSNVRTCVLLNKSRPDLPDRMSADYWGFEIGPEFVVGYGLDYGDLYRNLPDVCLLNPRVRGERPS